MKPGRHFMYLSAALATAWGAAPALAQDQTKVATTDAQDDASIPDIIVSARRQEESLQSVPVVASVFDANALLNKSINTLEDVQQAVPGTFFGVNSSPVRSGYSIRGQYGTGLVTYFAEVPLPPLLTALPQFDVGSLQILKGVQGTLFGRNTTGGAVLFFPQAPSDEFGGYVRLSAGSYEKYSAEGALNLPITDGLAVRIAGRLDRSGGYTKNLGVGPDFAKDHVDSLRGTIRWEPMEGLVNTLIVDWSHQPANGSSSVAQILIGGQPIPFVTQQLALQNARGPNVSNSDIVPVTTFYNWGITNRTELDLGAATITNLFGYRDVFYRTATNQDGIPAAFLNAYSRSALDQVSDELQVRTNVTDWAELLVGGFYAKSAPTGPDGTFLDLSGFLAALGRPPVNSPVSYNFTTLTSKAVFGHVQLHLDSILDGLGLSAGYRYTWDTFERCSGVGQANPTIDILPEECLTKLRNAITLSGKTGAPTWTATLDWQATPRLYFYGALRRGYRQGGLNSPSLGPNLRPYQVYGPEKSTEMEIGAKADWSLGGWRGRFNISAFDNKTDDIQMLGSSISTTAFQALGLACVPPNFTPFIDGDCDLTNDPGNSQLTVNAGSRSIRGVELEALISPMHGIDFGFQGAIMDDKTNGFDVPPLLSRFFPVLKLPLLYSPKKTFHVDASFLLPFPKSWGEVTLRSDYYWSDKVDFNGYIAPSYDTINARLDFRDLGGTGIDASIYGRNLTDANYMTGPSGVSAALPTKTVVFGPPRSFGVQLSYRFGS